MGNLKLVIKDIPILLMFFDEHGGYWDIDSSESENVSITWAPFLSDGTAYVPKIFKKRVYHLSDYYNKAKEEINSFLGEEFIKESWQELSDTMKSKLVLTETEEEYERTIRNV